MSSIADKLGAMIQMSTQGRKLPWGYQHWETSVALSNAMTMAIQHGKIHAWKAGTEHDDMKSVMALLYPDGSGIMVTGDDKNIKHVLVEIGSADDIHMKAWEHAVRNKMTSTEADLEV